MWRRLSCSLEVRDITERERAMPDDSARIIRCDVCGESRRHIQCGEKPETEVFGRLYHRLVCVECAAHAKVYGDLYGHSQTDDQTQ